MNDDVARELEALENILCDPSAEPIKLSYVLLKFITEKFSNEIGRGGFGIVYQGYLDNEVVAVKVCADSITNKQFMDEINCLKSVNHENIIRFLGYCAERQEEIIAFDGRFVMAGERFRLLCFEYVPQGNVRQYLEREEPHADNWPTRYQMIRGICQGLHYLHDKQICHLDLKPETVMLDDQMKPKIIGFGLSRLFDEGESRMYTQHIFGTLRYIAPERIDKNMLSFSSDIYALGIIIIELLSGISMISLQNWDESLDVDYPGVGRCAEIARKCTDAAIDNRPTIREVIHDLDELESMIPECSVSQLHKTRQRLKLAISTKQHSSRASPVKMTGEATNRHDLEHMLHHKDVEPRMIDFSLLRKITNGFCEEREIGRGGFGQVYKGVLSNQSVVAVKRLFRFKAHEDENFLNEVECLMRVKHRNIARFLGYCSLLKGEMLHKAPNDERRILADYPEKLLCFEYLSNGNLQTQLKDASCGLEWNTRYLVIKGICHGLNHLHENHIIHLDLKPQNILLDNDMTPKIVDFGSSRLMGDEKSQTITVHICGSWGYMAPEYLDDGIITLQCDIYSLGVILIEMVTGQKKLPNVENELEIWARRLGAPDAHTTLEQVKICLEIGKECVDHNPESRPVIQDIMRRLDEAETYNSSPGNHASTSSV